MGLISSISIPLACIVPIWVPATLFCCLPWVQKQMLYLHWVTFWPGKWLTEPERCGFLRNQVAPFRIPTKDGERLFAWLIAPIGVYSRNLDRFVNSEPGVDGDIERKLVYKLLRSDPEARLLIYFHGNTGTVAQDRRTEEYRMYSAGASEKIFVLTFDYRGFGKSTGTPSESGLLNDADAVVDWALTVANVPAERIVLLGHSLGTAVATGIAHRYGQLEDPVEFAGIILCASFTNAGNAFSAYSIAGVLPILAPIKMIPAFQAWFSRRMRDTWETQDRLATLARQSSKFRLVVVHAEDDLVMPWNMTQQLFQSTLKAAMLDDVSELEAAEKVRTIDLGEAGKQEIWKSGAVSISKLIAKHGGEVLCRFFVPFASPADRHASDHNTMMKWNPLSLAILECFGLSTPPEHAV
ncbi:Alpha/Beta hydrolase protein [Lophiotrema nucula]|uniref:Alpha/Beta hydrolase protein n=1 Tax=Lophiotrema nucula TaxID=690887 RepID=A0A6A5YPI0_9PLEO|nr:Alpha/Beta hydrolase protein [Lophiotrema nucula]